jgi:hypothetical protein
MFDHAFAAAKTEVDIENLIQSKKLEFLHRVSLMERQVGGKSRCDPPW